jgi:hypothetical protein
LFIRKRDSLLKPSTRGGLPGGVAFHDLGHVYRSKIWVGEAWSWGHSFAPRQRWWDCHFRFDDCCKTVGGHVREQFVRVAALQLDGLR